MADAGFIIGSYVITFASIAVFAAFTLRRARRLSRVVADEKKYWT
jgi:heme exporter protein CcmD